jgi:hypothetical protein
MKNTQETCDELVTELPEALRYKPSTSLDPNVIIEVSANVAADCIRRNEKDHAVVRAKMHASVKLLDNTPPEDWEMPEDLSASTEPLFTRIEKLESLVKNLYALIPTQNGITSKGEAFNIHPEVDLSLPDQTLLHDVMGNAKKKMP